MNDPITTSLLAGINTAFKLAEFGLSLRDAPEEVMVFCGLIRRVREDRAEAGRERRDKAHILNTLPLKKQWIEGIMIDVDEALFIIGRLVSYGGADGDKTRSMSLKHRCEWVLSKKESFLTKQSLLSTCHQSLSTAIGYMHSLPGLDQMKSPHALWSPPSYRTLVEQDNDDDDDMRAPSARRPKDKLEYKIPERSRSSLISRFSGSSSDS